MGFNSGFKGLKPYMFRSQLFDHLQGVVFRA